MSTSSNSIRSLEKFNNWEVKPPKRPLAEVSCIYKSVFYKQFDSIQF